MGSQIYLDCNASTPVDSRVLARMVEALECCPGNPSSTHSFGREARGYLSEARRQLARYFQVQPHEMIFTSGATEALNLVLRGVMGRTPRGHVITSALEHSAVYNTVQEWEANGCEVTWLEPDERGVITPEAVREAIRQNTVLITLMAVNNETGIKTEIDKIGELATVHNLPFVVDGVAWLGKERVVIPEGVSAICFSGHKVYAPTGIGCAYIDQDLQLHPFCTGGSHEFQRRSGTENLGGAVAMGAAVALIEQEQAEVTNHVTVLRDRLESGILRHCPNTSVNGTGPRVGNATNIAFHGIEGESLLIALDMQGVAVSHGSACNSGGLEPSRVLLKMGLSKDHAGSSIRFSVGRHNTEEEIDQALEIIQSVVRRLSSTTLPTS